MHRIETRELVNTIANVLKDYDSERPVHKTKQRTYQPGIGPFGEPQLVKTIAERLTEMGLSASTLRTPDMQINQYWGIEFKVVRPFGDNDKEAENWSQNLLHPYEGNVSLIGDAIKLAKLHNFQRKCVFAIGYEHNPARIDLELLFESFELITRSVVGIRLGSRIEERRIGLVHPTHQVVRCAGWEVN